MYRFLSVLFLSLVLHAHSAVAKDVNVFTAGAWTGTAYYDDNNGSFNFCTISGTYRSGITIFFALYPQGKWSIIFAREQGFSGAGQQQFTLYVDDKYVFGGEAERSGRLLVLPLPFSAPVLKAMYAGRELKVVSPNGTSYFGLKGTARAMEQLVECVKQRMPQNDQNSAAKNGEDAFGPGGGQRAQDDTSRQDGTAQDRSQDTSAQRKFERDELLKFVGSFLSAAGLDNYRILPYADTKGFGDVAWQFEDGLIGSIIAYRNAEKLPLNAVGTEALKTDAEACAGEFASAKKSPRYHQGMEIYEVGTACRAGEKSFNIQYSIVRMPSGAVVRLMSARVGQIAETQAPDSQRVERSEKALLSASPLR